MHQPIFLRNFDAGDFVDDITLFAKILRDRPTGPPSKLVKCYYCVFSFKIFLIIFELPRLTAKTDF